MSIPYYKAKFSYLYIRQNGLCPIAKEYGRGAKPNALHHKLHNTIENKKAFPLFINSIFNLVAVNNDWHLKNGSWGRMTEREAAKWERFLERHYKIAEWGNSLTIPDKHPCANCANCIVKLKIEKSENKTERLAYCKKLKWTPIYLHQIKDKYKYCPDYEPMGEEEDFMHEIKKLTYENTTEYKK